MKYFSTRWLCPTSILDVYEVFITFICCGVQPYCNTVCWWEVTFFGIFWKYGVVRLLNQMILWNHGIPHPTSIVYVYKVFYHLDMLWMGIWVHPITQLHIMSRWWVWIFEKIGGDGAPMTLWCHGWGLETPKTFFMKGKVVTHNYHY
jgi:hypothetical protein